MKKLLILSLPLLLLFSLGSCWKTEQCLDASLRLKFIGFDSMQLSHIILYKYQTGNTFSQLVDSFDIGTNNYVRDNMNDGYYPDSLIITRTMVPKPYDTTLTVNNFYDWKIYIPATGKSYFVSDISYDRQSKRIKTGYEPLHEACYNNISYYLNDTLFVLNSDSLYNKVEFYLSYLDYTSIKIYK